jgi:hypothetical protein
MVIGTVIYYIINPIRTNPIAGDGWTTHAQIHDTALKYFMVIDMILAFVN